MADLDQVTDAEWAAVEAVALQHQEAVPNAAVLRRDRLASLRRKFRGVRREMRKARVLGSPLVRVTEPAPALMESMPMSLEEGLTPLLPLTTMTCPTCGLLSEQPCACMGLASHRPTLGHRLEAWEETQVFPWDVETAPPPPPPA